MLIPTRTALNASYTGTNLESVFLLSTSFPHKWVGKLWCSIPQGCIILRFLKVLMSLGADLGPQHIVLYPSELER